jgi:hypothetical protein
MDGCRLQYRFFFHRKFSESLFGEETSKNDVPSIPVLPSNIPRNEVSISSPVPSKKLSLASSSVPTVLREVPITTTAIIKRKEDLRSSASEFRDIPITVSSAAQPKEIPTDTVSSKQSKGSSLVERREVPIILADNSKVHLVPISLVDKFEPCASVVSTTDNSASMFSTNSTTTTYFNNIESFFETKHHNSNSLPNETSQKEEDGFNIDSIASPKEGMLPGTEGQIQRETGRGSVACHSPTQLGEGEGGATKGQTGRDSVRTKTGRQSFAAVGSSHLVNLSEAGNQSSLSEAGNRNSRSEAGKQNSLSQQQRDDLSEARKQNSIAQQKDVNCMLGMDSTYTTDLLLLKKMSLEVGRYQLRISHLFLIHCNIYMCKLNNC